MLTPVWKAISTFWLKVNLIIRKPAGIRFSTAICNLSFSSPGCRGFWEGRVLSKTLKKKQNIVLPDSRQHPTPHIFKQSRINPLKPLNSFRFKIPPFGSEREGILDYSCLFNFIKQIREKRPGQSFMCNNSKFVYVGWNWIIYILWMSDETPC